METKFGGKLHHFYGPVVSDLKDVGKKSMEWDLNDWRWDGDLFMAAPLNTVTSDCRSRQLFPVGSNISVNEGASLNTVPSDCRSRQLFQVGSNIRVNSGASNCSLLWSEEVMGSEKEKRDLEKRRRVFEVENEQVNEEAGSLNLKLGGQVYPIVEGELDELEGKSGKKTKVTGAPSSHAVCQVEECKADLTNAKDYHRRHKVCAMHAKATRALVGNIMQRFCQQCSRFHGLQEFDEGKRSCRRRLAGHNKRRRKTHPDNLVNAATQSDEQGSNYLLISLLRILSNIHCHVEMNAKRMVRAEFLANNSDQTKDQDLLSHLLRNLAPTGLTNEGNPARPLPVSEDLQNVETSLATAVEDLITPAEPGVTIPTTDLTQKRMLTDKALGKVTYSEPTSQYAIQFPANASDSMKENTSDTTIGRNKLNNFDLNYVYDGSQDCMDNLPDACASEYLGNMSPAGPLWLYKDSQQSSPPHNSGNSGSTSSHSPSTSSGEAQSRTDRIVFKLFGKDPNDFPLVLRKQSWDLLKQAYQGNVMTTQMQVLNLKREFKMQKMNETEHLRSCGQMYHMEKVYKNKGQAQVVEQEHEEEKLFVAMCYASRTPSNDWLIARAIAMREICLLGKRVKLPLPIGKTWGATEKLQLIQTDTFGDVKIEYQFSVTYTAQQSGSIEQLWMWLNLDPKAEYGVFVGHNSTIKGYREWILDWLSNSPTDMESYIRPGCIILTIYLRMDKSSWDKLHCDLTSSLRRLVNSSSDSFWRTGWIYTRVQHRVTFVCNGEVVLDTPLPMKNHHSCRISSIKPIAVTVSEGVQFVVKGFNLSCSTSRLLCTMEGKYLVQENCADMTGLADSFIKHDEIQSLSFSCVIPNIVGRGFIEVEDHGLRSSFFPFIVAEEDVCSEICTLESILEDADEDINKLEVRNQALDFIHEMGWLLHRSRLKFRLGDSSGDVDLFPFKRFRWLIEFAVDRDWCAVVKKLISILFDGTVDLGQENCNLVALLDIGLLHRAVRRNCRSMVEFLLNCNPGVNLEKTRSRQKQPDGGQYLFRPDSVGPGGLTPLHVAASLDSRENVLDALTEDPGSVGIKAWKSKRDSSGLTAHDHACMRGNYSYVLLVEKKLNKKSRNGHVLIDIPGRVIDSSKLGRTSKFVGLESEKRGGECRQCDQKLGYGRRWRSSVRIYRPTMLCSSKAHLRYSIHSGHSGGNYWTMDLSRKESEWARREGLPHSSVFFFVSYVQMEEGLLSFLQKQSWSVPLSRLLVNNPGHDHKPNHYVMKSSNQKEENGSRTWCIVKPSTSEEKLDDIIQYCCTQPNVDCKVIQAGGTCYRPPNKISDASVVMNIYYHLNGRQDFNCDFKGSGLIVTRDPYEQNNNAEEERKGECGVEPGAARERYRYRYRYGKIEGDM
ncbi:UNVERIFIED_CONTAM: Squamosa promoter-binding-like protein 1 [Sesamum indicum]